MKKMKRRRLRQQQLTRIRLQVKPVMVFTAGCFAVVFATALFYNNVGNVTTAKASSVTEPIDSGSFIINMGIVPQTKNNALKPYGLVYEMITNFNTQVKWVIEPTKAKDGIDFTYNAINYKGGPFIIPAAYITDTMKTRIAYWQTQGVQGVYTISTINVPVYSTITVMPTMIIDNTSGKQGIITNYFTNAGIPSSAYAVGATTSLTSCHDLWINPHGDPTWASHSRLYNFAIADGSFIFSQCHATSMMEGCKNTVAPFQQLNFLSTTGLKCYSSGKCGPAITETHGGNATGPYTNSYPNDPMMQFMGTVSGALSGGSEDWFIPQSTGGWRSTTRRVVTTADGTSPGEGVLLAYGPAYGLANSGWVMYEAGHDFGGTSADEIAAQRAFLNFMIFAASRKSIDFVSDDVLPEFEDNSNTKASVVVSSGSPPYTYNWTASIPAIKIDSPYSASTMIRIPSGLIGRKGVITVAVTDACNRKNFLNRPIRIIAKPLPVSLLDFTVVLNKNNNAVDVNWKTASEKDNDYFTIERSIDGHTFEPIKNINGAGNSNTILKYYFTDENPVTGTSYYRLKQTDFNGDFTRSKVKIINNNYIKNPPSALEISSVAPSVFIDNFKINFISEEGGEVDFVLTSLSGQIMKREKIMAEKGHNSYQYTDEHTIPAGVYFVVLLCNDKKASYKVIKH